MPGLTLTLRPHERFLVGGCLVQNGPRRGSIRIADEHVFVLRLSDALHPDEVSTPVTRAYHAAQLILACEVPAAEGQPDLLRRLEELERVFAGTAHAATVSRARDAAAEGRFHAALIGIKAMMAVERCLLGSQPEDVAVERRIVSGRR